MDFAENIDYVGSVFILLSTVFALFFLLFFLFVIARQLPSARSFNICFFRVLF